MSTQDEVFGLPFLFTGGLPNSLEKFTEGNLRCFLIYLIEVVGKANRQNVWQQPAWWRSKLIPYSPIAVDTRRVPQEQVVKELRGLVESCYRFYNAEKILEVSRQLAEIPRILLGIRDNKDNTMTVYDTNSKAVYVTVRPENLFYDAKSLDKVSKDWRSNYTKEDGTFCEIKKAFKHENHYSNEMSVVIEVSDSSDEDKKKPEVKESKRWSLGGGNMVQDHSNCKRASLPSNLTPNKQPGSRGVVIRSGDELVIALSDSDDEVSATTFDNRLAEDKIFHHKKEIKNDHVMPADEADDDVEFVCEMNFSRPCPKRFKKHPKNAVVFNPGIIILSDSDDDAPPEERGICISSYTSLAKNYSNMKYYTETPTKNAQKSILGPLICSPRKDPQAHRTPQVVPSPLRWPQPSKTPRTPDSFSTVQLEEEKARKPCQGSGGSTSINQKRNLPGAPPVSSDDDDISKPTKEELYLRKKKNRTFYSSPASQLQPEPPCLQADTQREFMALLGMKESSICNEEVKQVDRRSQADFVTVIRSLKGSLSRMPMEWLQALSSNHFVLSKRSQRSIRHLDPTRIHYEPFCSTDKSFIEYNIKSANASVGKEGRSNSRQGRRGTEKNSWTVERWWLQSEEGSQRSKRAALRMLRSLCSGDHATAPKDTLFIGTLAPTLVHLPDQVFERALHSTIYLKDTY